MWARAYLSMVELGEGRGGRSYMRLWVSHVSSILKPWVGPGVECWNE